MIAFLDNDNSKIHFSQRVSNRSIGLTKNQKEAILEHLLETTLVNYNSSKVLVSQLCNKSKDEFLWLGLWGVEQLYRGHKRLEATLRQACIMLCNWQAVNFHQ